MPERRAQDREDHDLLIRLDEKVEILITKVDTLTNDHETRIRRLERWGLVAIGVLYALQFYIQFFR